MKYSNRILTTDYLFENMQHDKLLREELIFHKLVMINTVNIGTTKDDLTKISKTKTAPRGTHVVYQNTNDEGETYFMLAWKGKKMRRKKMKEKLHNYYAIYQIPYHSTWRPRSPKKT